MSSYIDDQIKMYGAASGLLFILAVWLYNTLMVMMLNPFIFDTHVVTT